MFALTALLAEPQGKNSCLQAGSVTDLLAKVMSQQGLSRQEQRRFILLRELGCQDSAAKVRRRRKVTAALQDNIFLGLQGGD